MNSVVEVKPASQLPATLWEVTNFVLFSNEKMASVKAEIRAMKKLGVAEEVVRQKEKELQMVGEALIDAQVALGKLTSSIEHRQGKRSDITSYPHGKEVTKEQKLQEIGLTVKQASEFEQMARNPEAVEEAKAEARENNKPVTRKGILKKIKAQKQEGSSIVIDISTVNNAPKQTQKEFNTQDKLQENYFKLVECLLDISDIFDKHSLNDLTETIFEHKNVLSPERILEQIENLQLLYKAYKLYKPMRLVK